VHRGKRRRSSDPNGANFLTKKRQSKEKGEKLKKGLSKGRGMYSSKGGELSTHFGTKKCLREKRIQNEKTWWKKESSLFKI